jgi:hypothetical protein
MFNGIAPKGNSGPQYGPAKSKLLRRLPQSPDTQCAGAALIEGGNPQAPQSPGGFALAFAGRRSGSVDRRPNALIAPWPPGRPSSPYTRRLASSAAIQSLDMHKDLPDAYNKTPMPVYAASYFWANTNDTLAQRYRATRNAK